MENKAESSRSYVTRQDRAVNDEAWIVDLLRRAPTGVLATAEELEGEPQPFVSTLLFVYDSEQRAVYLHTAKRGRAFHNIHENGSRVCFTVSEIGRLLPAKTALNFSVEYSSVVVFGPAEQVEDPVEAECALQKLLDKYFPHLQPGRDYRAITQGELQATAVYRLRIEEWSGKRKAVPEDFPGAFRYGEAPNPGPLMDSDGP